MTCLNQFVYLDLSPTSLAIAKARAQLAGCTNVKWIQVNKILQQEQALATRARSCYESKLFKSSFLYAQLQAQVEFAQDRIERLPQLNLGHFDFIECSGVG